MSQNKEIHAKSEINRYHKIMEYAKEILGKKCVECGTLDNLEFDHIDPKTKLFTISSGWSLNPESFWLEVIKCQLLCKEHHIIKTSSESFGFLLGLNNPNNELTESNIKQIRILYTLGISQYKLAEQFNVSRPTITDIVNGKIWGWFEPQNLPIKIKYEDIDMKKCTQGNHLTEIKNFGPNNNPNSKTKLKSSCRSCLAEYTRVRRNSS